MYTAYKEENTMVEKKELDNLIWQILRGYSVGFMTCGVIHEGVSYKKSIPKAFWRDENKGVYGILGFDFLSKAELRKVRDEVISRIIKEINEPGQSEMLPDHYSRLFHALELLKVDKRDPLIPQLGKDYR